MKNFKGHPSVIPSYAFISSFFFFKSGFVDMSARADNDVIIIDVICHCGGQWPEWSNLWNILRKGRVKGAFLSPFSYSPSPFSTSSLPFFPLSLPLYPSLPLRTCRLVALKVYGGVQGAGGMERGERGGRRKKWRKWDGEKEKGGGFKRVKGEGERRSLLCPPHPQKIVGTQIFLVQLNGVWAPLCKAKLFWVMRNGERIDSIEIIIYNVCILWWKHNSYELTFFMHARKQVGGGGEGCERIP